MMFRPRESHDLRLLDARLDIVPRPTRLRWVHDVFDNSVAVANFSGRTTELRFDSTVTLEHIETTLPDYALEREAATYPFTYAHDELLPGLGTGAEAAIPDPGHRSLGDELSRVRQGSADTIALLRAMTIGIPAQLTYVRRPERGVQTPSETLQRGSGSCRDFALLMIDGVRSLGFAARFVSGYIFVPGSEPSRLLGGGADSIPGCRSICRASGWIRFRSDQRHHRQSQPHSSRRGLGSGAGPPAALGELHRLPLVLHRHGGRGQRHREPRVPTSEASKRQARTSSVA